MDKLAVVHAPRFEIAQQIFVRMAAERIVDNAGHENSEDTASLAAAAYSAADGFLELSVKLGVVTVR